MRRRCALKTVTGGSSGRPFSLVVATFRTSSHGFVRASDNLITTDARLCTRLNTAGRHLFVRNYAASAGQQTAVTNQEQKSETATQPGPAQQAASALRGASGSWGKSLWELTKEKARQVKDGTIQLSENAKHSWLLIQKRNVLGTNSLTRKEVRFLAQTKRDLVWFVPFVTLFGVLPEVLPLLIIFAPSSLPSVYKDILPHSLYQKIAKKKAEGKAKAAVQLKAAAAQHPLLSNGNFFAVLGTPAEGHWRSKLDVANMEPSLLRSACILLDIPTLARPQSYLRWRLNKRFDYLAVDDALIRREGVGSLSPGELSEALDERGILYHQQHLPEPSTDAPFREPVHLLKDWLAMSHHPKCPPKVIPLLHSVGVPAAETSSKAQNPA